MGVLGALSKACRKFLRFYFQSYGRPDFDLDLLERNVLGHLYEREAGRLGLRVVRLGEILSIEGGGKVFKTSGPLTEFDIGPVNLICGDKLMVRDILRGEGIRVPESASFGRKASRQAFAYAASFHGPCVVKPARATSSGHGVTVGIAGKLQFRRAFWLAGLFCEEVLIERFVPGRNYRFLVYKGKCLSAILRELAFVVGDGTSTILALVDAINRTRIQSADWNPGDPVLMPIPKRKFLDRALASQGLTRDSVPAAGRRVEVSMISNYTYGPSYVEVLQTAHPGIVAAAERSAVLLGAPLAGVDVISADIRSGDYMINEVNTTPGLDIHYYASNEAERKAPIYEILKDIFGPDR